MKVLSPNDIRWMVRKRAIQTGTYKAWAELNGVHPNHLSNFMKGWCGPPVGVLEALGIVRVYMLATDAPPGHDDGHVTRRKPNRLAREAAEDPMS